MFTVDASHRWLTHPCVDTLRHQLVTEYAPEGATGQAVAAQLQAAVAAVVFVGDDPTEHLDVVERIARRHLDVLVERTVDRART